MSDMVKKNTLEAMPDVVMTRILTDCNYADCQSLRKTCSRLRCQVDLLKPDPKIEAIRCILNGSIIKMELRFFDGPHVDIRYENMPGVCVVTNKRRRYFKSTTAASVFCKDFQTLKASMIRQSTPLEEFRVTVNEEAAPVFYDTIAPLLAEPAHIRVGILQLEADHPRHFMAVLPFVSPEALETVQIRCSSEQPDVLLNLDEISELDQWRSIKTLDISHFAISDPTRVTNIPNIFIRMSTLSAEQLTQFKEKFQNAPNSVRCFIRVDNFANRIPALRSVVPDVRDKFVIDAWYFRTQRQGKLLRLCAANDDVTFESVDFTELLPIDTVRD